MDDQTTSAEESLLPRNVVPEPEAVPLQQQVYVLMLFGGYVWDTQCGNLRIFSSLRLYVKSILRFKKGRNYRGSEF